MYKSGDIKTKSLNDVDNTIDLKKSFNKLLKNWYWFIICTFIGGMVAYAFCWYMAPVYKINARVLVNDQQKGGGLNKQADALMDLGGIMGSNSSVDNEAEILKTPDLLETVVRGMNLNVVYSSSVHLSRRELYKSPFKMFILKGRDSITTTDVRINKLASGKVRVRTDDIDREVNWNTSFDIPNVGLVQLSAEPGFKMSDADYFVEVSSVDERVTNLMKDLTVEVGNNKVTIVDLSLNYPVQKKGEEILNALIDKYESSNIQDKNSVADSTYSFIKERLSIISSELGDVENKVQQFKQKNRLSDMSEQGKLLVQTTGEYSTELAKAETQVSVLTDLENYLKDETKNKRVFPTSLLPSDMVFSNLMNQYNALLTERDKTMMSVTEATPFVQSLNNQIANLRQGILANIQSTKNTYVVTRNRLRSQLQEAQGQIEGVPAIEKNYLKLARNQQIKQELYIFLMQKAEETLISKTSNTSIAKVIAKPKSEVHPISPKKKIIYFVGILAGLIIPLLVTLGKDFFNTTIVTKDDISNATQVPIVGEISHSLVNDNLIVSNHGRSAIAEQFRALRSNLSFYLKSKDQKIILVTSSMSGEGKSFTSINLGNVLALLGKKVLLMEMDLRKPGLSGKFKIKNDIGFSNYIIDDNLTASDIVRPLDVNKNLFIITSGLLPPNPVEILMNARTAVLMSELKEQFDYIIMDAPPIGVISDAQSLAEYADMTIYVVRQNVTDKKQLMIVEQLYQTNKIDNIGIVVNDVNDKDYNFGYNYGTYGQELPAGMFKRMIQRFK
jgi:tyrosine-protein kinase Etk/Wzc